MYRKMSKESVGKRLAILRSSTGLTRQQVEEQTNGELMASSLSNYERGAANLSLNKIMAVYRFYSQHLSVDLNWLLLGKGTDPQSTNSLMEDSILEEINSFQSHQNHFVTMTKTDNAPYWKKGDFIGGVKKQPSNEFMFWILQTKTGDIIIEAGEFNNDYFIYQRRNNAGLAIHPRSDIDNSYALRFLRNQDDC